MYSAEEFHGSLHLYGHLLSLSTRPMSEGNDIAIKDAVDEIQSCANHICKQGNNLIPVPIIEIIRNMLEMSDMIPVRNLAQVVTGSVSKILLGLDSECSAWPVAPPHGYAPQKDLERIVVSVGPTIGLGDELILAKALIEKAGSNNVAIHVETRRFALWNYHKIDVEHLGPPPSSIFHCLDKLSPASLQKTGYLYVDFLSSDPADIPNFKFESLAFTGRWIFGNATAKIAQFKSKTVYVFKYPNQMPGSRALQCDWISGSILDTDEITNFNNTVKREKTARPRRKKILLQMLTSKPELILSPSFYQTCFSDVKKIIHDDFTVEIISGPTESTRKINQAVCDALAKVTTTGHVRLSGIRSLDRVVNAVKEADLLVGPDTFTAHIAAHLNTPQITFFLPQHHSWVNSACQGFYLPYRKNREEELSRAIARRINFMLGFGLDRADDRLLEYSQLWTQALGQLYISVYNFLLNKRQKDPIPLIAEQMHHIEPIIDGAADIIKQTLKNDVAGLKCPEKIGHLSSSEHMVDKNIKRVAHWYHYAGSCDLSGVLYSISNRYNKGIKHAGF